MTVQEQVADLEAAIAAGTPFGPADPEEPKVEISAEALRTVLLRTADGEGVERLWLQNAKVADGLDLEAARIGVRLTCQGCEFKEPLNLSQATGFDVELISCDMDKELRAAQLDLRRNLHLINSTFAQGVAIPFAKIGGRFSMIGATVESAGGENLGIALNADGLEVNGDALLRSGFESTGELRLLGAKIGGRLSMVDATIEGEEVDGRRKTALNADRLEVKGSMYCGKGFQATGEVRLLGAKIGGQLAMNGATLNAENSEDGLNRALNADRIDVEGGIFCGKGFEAVGEVRMIGARIGGQIGMDRATLKGTGVSDSDVVAFNADRAEVEGGIFCSPGFEALGEVRLLSARIRSQLSLSGATLVGAKVNGRRCEAFSVDGAQIGSDLRCSGDFSAIGEVRLIGVKVGGQLYMNGARIHSDGDDPESLSLNAERIDVGESMFCGRGFESVGEMRLLGAKIGGTLSLGGASLIALSEDANALRMTGANLDELALALNKSVGTVDLRGATVRSLWDAEDGDFVGEPPKKLRLDGFAYESLREPLDADRRLRWIEPSQKDGYHPGVYTELSNAFRRIGHESDARQVAIAGERQARGKLRKWSPRRAWHDMLYVTVGYGYRNWFAAVWLTAFLVIGVVLFSIWDQSFEPIIAKPPGFDPVLYTLDVTIPVLDIGQQRAWAPTGSLAYARLFLIVGGYALATALVAAAAGLLNRDQR